MTYVDGYVLTVPKKKLSDYRKLANFAAKVWKKHGALEYTECVGDDMNCVKECGGVPFPKLANAKTNEEVIFAFVKFKSKRHRDIVNKKVMEELEKADEKWKTAPFDMKKMAWGGFKTIVKK